jgi:hypothetical protein
MCVESRLLMAPDSLANRTAYTHGCMMLAINQSGLIKINQSNTLLVRVGCDRQASKTALRTLARLAVMTCLSAGALPAIARRG